MSQASLTRSDTLKSSIPGTVPSTGGASLEMEATSTAATSLSVAASAHAKPPSASVSKEADAMRTMMLRPGGLAVSPAPTMSRRLSEASDAGSKEILLSDRESIAAPKMSFDSFGRGPIDEPHPDLQTFYPAGTSIARPARSSLSNIVSPLSPMTEEENGRAPRRRVGAVPDLSSPLTASTHDGSLGQGPSPLIQHQSLTEGSLSFRSVRSFRSTSDGSVRRYRPLPVVPVRSRGYSLDPTMNRRDPSYGPDSFVTADTHSRYGSVEQPEARRIDDLPEHDTQLSPLMLMGMVTAASSPTQWTHSSHGQPSAGPERHGRGLSSSSSASATSPMNGPRPLPSVPIQSIDAVMGAADVQAKASYEKRLSMPVVGSVGGEGPPLSPSAFYDNRAQTRQLSTRSPAGPRDSWDSAKGPWSAALVTSSATLGAVRGLARPERAINDAEVLRRALSQPREDTYPSISVDSQINSQGSAEDDDAELSRLEKSRSGSKMLPPPRMVNRTELSDSAERAPYADTGVQASLAALRALESPGESLRTILARQRLFGEPDASVIEFLRESRILESKSRIDDQEVLAMSGPRQRRRAAPYPSLRDSYYSSEELSSSGRSLSGRRAQAARRRRHGNYTGMAEGSSASLAETSGRNSDSEGATLAAIRSARKVSTRKLAESHAPGRRSSVPHEDAPAEALPTASHLRAWEDLAGIVPSDKYSLEKDGRTLATTKSVAGLAMTSPAGYAQSEERVQRPRHDRYVTALSHPAMDREVQQADRIEPTQAEAERLPEVYDDGALSPSANVDSPTSTMSPALLLKHERLASQIPSSTAGSRIAFPSFRGTQKPLLDQQRFLRSPSLPQDLTRAEDRDTHSLDTQTPGTAISRQETDADRMTRRMLAQQRQRSRSDAHPSSVRNSQARLRRSGRPDADRSRYDAQLEDLLLLREKVLQLGSSTGHGRFESQDLSFDHGRTNSIQEEPSYSIDRSAMRPRKSSTSSRRKSRTSKLGYTMPDIMAWQAGLGKSNAVSSKIV